MNFIAKLISKAGAVSLNNWGILLLLMAGAFIKSVALVCLDGGSVAGYLRIQSGTFMAFDFMLAAVLLVVAGYYQLLFERRHGYGSVPICAALIILLIGLIWGTHSGYIWAINGLFIVKFAAFVIFGVSFWTIASRFIPMRLDSLKFLAVFCFELWGYLLTGWFLGLTQMTPVGVLIISLFALLILLAIFKGLIELNPVPSETFIKKVGGAQDLSGQRLIRYIFAVSFTYMFAKGLMTFVFYTSLIGRPFILHDMGLLWGLFGGIGLCMILLLYQTRYLYTTVLGLAVLSASLIFTAGGVVLNSFGLILTGMLVFMLTSYFYVPHYFEILPRPLAVGWSKRIKWRRLLVIEPLGFLCAGMFLFYFEEPYMEGAALVLTGLGLFFLIGRSVKLYSDILMDSFKRRQWRGGPLMIALPKLLNYILSHLKTSNADEALYFIRILGISKHPEYQRHLLKLLKHPSAVVRAYVLGRIEQLYEPGFFSKTIENVFIKDDSFFVRQKAVTLLMRVDYEQKGIHGLDKYMGMLNDKKIRPGILIGLLKLGGDPALMAMDTLQKMAFSKKYQDVITALQVIESAPLTGLVRLVAPQMKSVNPRVAAQAILTAGAMRHPQLLPAVFEALDDLTLQEYALIALELYGKRAFPPLEKMLHNPLTPAYRQKTLILFLNALPSGEGKQILLRAMTVDNQKLRKSVMTSLINSGIIWIHKSKKALLTAGLKKDLNRLNFELKFIDTQTQAPTHETEESFLFLRRALIEDIKDTRELILLQLHLLKPHPLFTKAIRILLSDRTDQYETALGVVQDFLPGRLYQQVKAAALLPLQIKRVQPDKVVSESHVAKTLSDLLTHPPFVLPAWVKATVLYCLRKLGNEQAKEAVIQTLNDKNPLVLEAAIWALVRLEKDKALLHEKLLTLPTSQLVGQSLDEILES